MKFIRNLLAASFLALGFLAAAEGNSLLGLPDPAADSTLITLGGQLEGTQLFYTVNTADPRADRRDTVTMTYIIPKEAWLSVAFTEGNSQMVGSEAVIGLPDTGEVVKYAMRSQVPAGVVRMPDAQQTLIETSIAQSEGVTRMQFTKILVETGENPINIGSNIFLAAYGFDNTLFLHDRRDAFTVDLEVGESQALETRNKRLWKAHGLCAAIAWAYAAPLAIAAAVVRYWLPNGWWFTIHQALNSIVAVLTLLAFAFAVAAIQSEGLPHFNPSPFPHKLVGLILFWMVLLQILGGIFRPHTPKKGETKTPIRGYWEIGHRLLGITVVLMAWYQCISGIDIYQTLFVASAETNLKGIVYGSIGSIIAITLIGRLFAYLAEKNDPESEESPDEEDLALDEDNA